MQSNRYEAPFYCRQSRSANYHKPTFSIRLQIDELFVCMHDARVTSIYCSMHHTENALFHLSINRIEKERIRWWVCCCCVCFCISFSLCFDLFFFLCLYTQYITFSLFSNSTIQINHVCFRFVFASECDWQKHLTRKTENNLQLHFAFSPSIRTDV